MAVSVVMPALEMAQETGKLVSWKKKEGEKVAKGEMLLEVETDKAVVEIEAQGDGILGGVTAKVGDVVPVGQTIAWLLKPGEQPPAATAPTQTGRTMDKAPRPRLRPPRRGRCAEAAHPGRRGSRRRRAGWRRSLASTSAGSRVRAGRRDRRRRCAGGRERTAAAPRLRRPLRSRGCARRAAAASGAGPGGRAQLDRPAHGRADDAELDDGSAFLRDARGRRQRAGRGAREARARRSRRRRGVKLTYTDLLTAIVARVLQQHPRMNAQLDGRRRSRRNAEVNVGLAMAVNDGGRRRR